MVGEPDCVSRRRIPRHLFKCLTSALRALAFIPLLFILVILGVNFRSDRRRINMIPSIWGRASDGSSAALNAGIIQSANMVV